MADSMEELTDTLLALPRNDRADLAYRLLESLDDNEEDLTAWEAEIARRLQDVRDGKVECRDARKAVLEIMSELA